MKFYSHRVIGNIMIIINKQEEPGSVKLGAEGNMRSSCSSIGSSIVGSSIGSSIGLFNGRSEKSVNLSGFSTCFCHFFCFFTLIMHIQNQFWKKISPGLLFLAGVEAQTFCLRPGRVATAYSTDKYKCKMMKIRVSWVGQSTRTPPLHSHVG